MGEAWTDDSWNNDEIDDLAGEYERELAALAAADKLAQEGPPAREIAYEPFVSQQLFHDCASRYKGFSGPVGSGKSKALAVEVLRVAYANPGLPGVVGAPTYAMLRDITRAAFLDLLEASGIPHEFAKAANEVYLPECAGLVRFRSLDNPQRLIGANLAWFAVDELTYCKEDGWRRLEARLRHPRAKLLQGFAAWTPKGFDWVYERFISPQRVAGYTAVLARPRENTALAEGFYESLKASYDQRFYEQEVLGKYLPLFAGQAYYAFDRNENVRKVEFDLHFPLIWAMDFNVNPMASVVGQVVGGELKILQEIILPNSNTREACKVFRERIQPYMDARKFTPYGVAPLEVKVYGDASGESRRSSSDKTDWQIVRDFLRDERHDIHGELHTSSTNPTVKARVNEVNALILNVQGERRLFIDPSCKELMADFEQVAWKTDAAGNTLTDLDKSNPKRTHVSDALGYLVDKEFGLRAKGGYKSTNLGV